MADSAIVVATISAATLTITTTITAAASLLAARRSKVAQNQSLTAANASTAAAQNSAAAVTNTAGISDGWSDDVTANLNDIAATVHRHVNDKRLHHYHRPEDKIIRE